MQKSFTVPPGALAPAVKYVARWLAARPAAPIQACIRFAVEDRTLTLTGFNENTTAHAALTVEGEASGAFVVSGRLIAALVDTFADKAVTFEEDGAVVAVSAGRWHGTLPTMPVEDYPPLPAEAPFVGAIDGNALADAVRRVGVAAGRDEKIPTYLGMQLVLGDEALSIVATDSLRAAKVDVPWSPAPTVDPFSGKRILVLAATLLDAADGFVGLEPVRIGVEAGGSLSLSTSTRTLITPQIIDDRYPDLMPLLRPQPGAVIVAVKARDMIEPLKRAVIVQGKTDTPPTVRLDFTAGTVSLSASRDEAGGGDEDIDIEYDGPEMAAILRSALLNAGLSSAPGEVVHLSIVPGSPTTTRAVLVTTPADASWTYVTMPVRTR